MFPAATDWLFASFAKSWCFVQLITIMIWKVNEKSQGNKWKLKKTTKIVELT